MTPVAGTTRDAVESYYNKFGHEFILVDTAGLRKKSKVNEDLEFYSVMRAIRAIEHADICILMIDAQYGVEAQDMSIFNLILRNSKGCVVAVNKWDLGIRRGHTQAARAFQRYPRHLHIGHQKAKNPRCAGRGGQGL